MSGKTLYDDQGNPVTGELYEYSSGQVIDATSYQSIVKSDNNTVNIIARTISSDAVVRTGTGVSIKAPLSAFGEAEPWQVAKDITFTSKEGLLVTGTHECDTGVQLPEFNNAATDDEVFLDKEYINASGQKRTGSFSIDSELTEQDSLINQITEALKNKAFSGDSGDSVTINATIDGLTVTSYTIPSGRHSGYGTVSLTSDIENALAAI